MKVDMNKLKSINPSNKELLGEIEVSSEAEIKRKVANAQKAKEAWKSLGLEKRVKILREISQNLVSRKEEIAVLVSKEMGMPINDSRYDVDDSVRYFNWYLDNAEEYLSPEVVYDSESVKHTVYYEPLGVDASIAPWNFPLSNFVWLVGQNLIAGNCVVFKHSEEVPLFGKLIEEIINSCGLPEGVFSEVYGDGKVGDFLARQNINLICFTGSTRAGKYLYKVGAEKFIKVLLELGGSAPGVIFEDTSIDKVLNSIYSSRFGNCGQMCDALKRLIIHESKMNEVLEKLKAKLESLKIGNALDESTELGPLVAERQIKLLEEQVGDALSKGAMLVTGGTRHKGLEGFFYLPTILINIKRNMRVWKEEIFGPVLPVVSFKKEEKAVELANDTSYGLGGYLYTEDKEKAKRVASKLQTGMVSINGLSYLQPCSPFGGYKDSGIGREHGRFGFHDVTQVKVVA